MKKEFRDKITAQALTEITFARRYKQGKVKNWQKNEDLYYSKKVTTDESRANVDLARMQEFVHTLLSKIDAPLTFKFKKRKEAQYKRVQRLNALKEYDSDRDNWDIKDIVGKKQAILYGRANYSYFADSVDGYQPHLENIDVYDFLVDPAAGGIDLEQARYLGNYGVVFNRSELEKSKLFIKSEVRDLLEGAGNATEQSQEETNKDNRVYGQNHQLTKKEWGDPDKFKFWRWCTTYEGERYYLLLSEKGGKAIRIDKLSDVFESNLWPYWSWAAFPDLTEFWTPSYADYVREIFMAQTVSINQMLDNAERVNKPQRLIDANAIQNLAELKYRRDGYIKMTGGADANRAMKLIEVPPIETPIKVFEILERIHERSSGVTAAEKGIADTQGRATIYEGNQANAADRFGLLNKSYAHGYKRFAKLWELGVREHLTTKMAIDILGPKGLDVEMVSRRDIFRKGDIFATVVESSEAELALSETEKRTKLAFLSSQLMNPTVNMKINTEYQGKIAGFTDEEMRHLMDNTEGDSEIMSEAEADIESILDGKVIPPNPRATTGYKQRFVHYMMDHMYDIDMETFNRLSLYIRELDQVIMSNMMRKAENDAMLQLGAETPGTGASMMRVPGPSQPLQDVIQQNDPQI